MEIKPLKNFIALAILWISVKHRDSQKKIVKCFIIYKKIVII